jgi:hypothetical protein
MRTQKNSVADCVEVSVPTFADTVPVALSAGVEPAIAPTVTDGVASPLPEHE